MLAVIIKCSLTTYFQSSWFPEVGFKNISIGLYCFIGLGNYYLLVVSI